MSGSDHGAVDFPAMGSLDIGDANDLLRSIRATYGLVYPLLLIEPSKINSFVTSIKISNWEGGRDDISSSFALYNTIPDDDRIFISKIIAMDGDNRGTIEIVGRYSCLRTSFRAAEAWLDDDEGRVFNAAVDLAGAIIYENKRKLSTRSKLPLDDKTSSQVDQSDEIARQLAAAQGFDEINYSRIFSSFNHIAVTLKYFYALARCSHGIAVAHRKNMIEFPFRRNGYNIEVPNRDTTKTRSFSVHKIRIRTGPIPKKP